MRKIGLGNNLNERNLLNGELLVSLSLEKLSNIGFLNNEGFNLGFFENYFN